MTMETPTTPHHGHVKKPSYLKTLPDTIVQSPTGISKLPNSPFPSLDPTKHFKSVYERAGFDVYKPPSKSPSRRVVSDNFKSQSVTQLPSLAQNHAIMNQKRNVSEQLINSVRNYSSTKISQPAGKSSLRIDPNLANESYKRAQNGNIPTTASSKASSSRSGTQLPQSSTTSHHSDISAGENVPGSVYASALSFDKSIPISAPGSAKQTSFSKNPFQPHNYDQSSQRINSPQDSRFTQASSHNTSHITSETIGEQNKTSLSNNYSNPSFANQEQTQQTQLKETNAEVVSPVYSQSDSKAYSLRDLPQQSSDLNDDIEADISALSVNHNPQPVKDSSSLVNGPGLSTPNPNELNVSSKHASYISTDLESLQSGVLSPRNHFDFEPTQSIDPVEPIPFNSIDGVSTPRSLIQPQVIPQFKVDTPDEDDTEQSYFTKEIKPPMSSDPVRFSGASSVYNDDFSPRKSVSPDSNLSDEFESFVEVKESRDVGANEKVDILSVDQENNTDIDDIETDSEIEGYSTTKAFEDVEGELANLSSQSRDIYGHDETSNSYIENDKLRYDTQSKSGLEQHRELAHQNLISSEPSDTTNQWSTRALENEVDSHDIDNSDLSKPLQIEMHSVKQVSTEDLSLNQQLPKPSTSNQSSKLDSELNPTPSVHVDEEFDNKSLEVRSLQEDVHSHVDNEPEVIKYAPGEGPCRKCHLEITTKPIYSKTGELSGQWHRQCFRCTLCDVRFNKNMSCFVLDDEPYCEYHYHQTNNSLCKVCGNGIVGKCLENDAQERYHVECLKCTGCQKLVDSDYLSVNGAVFCEPCALEFTKSHQTSKVEKRRTRLSFI